jgi:amino acid adenylation domain-containing protein
MQQVKARNANVRPLVPATVADVINQHCSSQKLAPAVCAWDGDLTYQDLDRESSYISGILESHGTGPEMFVPIYMDRSRWIVVAALAVLKVGAAFMLLDTSYPQGRLRNICDDIQAPCIICSESGQQDAGVLIDQVVVVGNKHLALYPHTTHRRHSLATDPHQALYAVFTSGSTGKPKGAVVENGAFVTMAAPWTHTMKVDAHSRILHLASYAFDVSILEILGTLFAGACICIPSESGRREGVAEAVQTLQPTHAILTPSLLRAMTPADLGPAKTVMLIGEPIRASDVVQWADHVRLINAYGPAECTVVYTMQPSVDIPSQASNIRHPTAGAAWVADPIDPNRPVPIGAVGELLLQGPLVGRGCLNNTEQTVAAFIDCPSWLVSSDVNNHQCTSKVYRTGDLVRYDSDGSLCFVGRRDSQVKLPGQRFELGVVEEQVQRAFEGSLSDIMALIVAPNSAQQAPYLVMFVVPPDPDSAPEASPSLIPPLPAIEPGSFASRTYKAQCSLENTLPSYMLPKAIIPLRQMPRTIGGKLDRQQLQEAAAGLDARRLASFTLTDTKTRIASTEA